jgi:hypothetical protein
MKSLRLFVGLLLVLAVPVIASAKGITTRVVIKSPDLTTPIEITDPEVLKGFVVWAGPGVKVNGTEQSEGFIIDWLAGVVAERPKVVRHYEVSFYVKYVNRPLEGQEDQLAYVVFYQSDPTGEQGYVYLPGRADEWYRLNTRAIFRGVEGNWFRATSAWQRVVTSLVAQPLQR